MYYHDSRLRYPVPVEVNWPTGGKSFYGNDPDGHVLEIATAGLPPAY